MATSVTQHRHSLLFVLLNAVGWLWFLSFPLLFIRNDAVSAATILTHPAYWSFSFSFIVLYYLHTYAMMPWVLNKPPRYVYYVLALLGLCVIYVAYLRPFDRLLQVGREPVPHSIPAPPIGHPRPAAGFPPPPKNPGMPKWDAASMYIFLLVVVLGALVRIVQHWVALQRRMIQVAHEQTRAELASLKAQVHPHFLFNTLHNIYALATTQNPATAESIFRLSQLMRYFVDEKERQEIPLSEEVKALQDYVALQKLRLGRNAVVHEHYEGLDRPKHITPFVFMPLVENAFKYGISHREDSSVDVNLRVYMDRIELTVRNTTHRQGNPTHGTGFGLKNTRQLLALSYPGRHTLDIQPEEDYFTVNLTIYC